MNNFVNWEWYIRSGPQVKVKKEEEERDKESTTSQRLEEHKLLLSGSLISCLPTSRLRKKGLIIVVKKSKVVHSSKPQTIHKGTCRFSLLDLYCLFSFNSSEFGQKTMASGFKSKDYVSTYTILNSLKRHCFGVVPKDWFSAGPHPIHILHVPLVQRGAICALMHIVPHEPIQLVKWLGSAIMSYHNIIG